MNAKAAKVPTGWLTIMSILGRPVLRGLTRWLPENFGMAFMGDTKGGPFDIPEALAREMLASPNPDGRSNADVVRPWANGLDVTRRPRGRWIIDFGTDMPLDRPPCTSSRSST